MNCMLVLTVGSRASDPLQPDGRELSVLLTFHNNSTPSRRPGNLASWKASIDYTALAI